MDCNHYITLVYVCLTNSIPYLTEFMQLCYWKILNHTLLLIQKKLLFRSKLINIKILV